jgi:hypothetical protein
MQSVAPLSQTHSPGDSVSALVPVRLGGVRGVDASSLLYYRQRVRVGDVHAPIPAFVTGCGKGNKAVLVDSALQGARSSRHDHGTRHEWDAVLQLRNAVKENLHHVNAADG